MTYEIIETLKAKAAALREAEKALEDAKKSLEVKQADYLNATEEFAVAQEEIKKLQEALASVSDLASSSSEIEVDYALALEKQDEEVAKTKAEDEKVLEEVAEEKAAEIAEEVVEELFDAGDDDPVAEELVKEAVTEVEPEPVVIVEEKPSEEEPVKLPVFEGVSEKTMERLKPAMILLLQMDANDDLPVSYDDFGKALGDKYTKRQVTGLLNKLESLGWIEKEDDLFAFPVEEEEASDSSFAKVDVTDDPFYEEELDVDEIIF